MPLSAARRVSFSDSGTARTNTKEGSTQTANHISAPSFERQLHLVLKAKQRRLRRIQKACKRVPKVLEVQRKQQLRVRRFQMEAAKLMLHVACSTNKANKANMASIASGSKKACGVSFGIVRVRSYERILVEDYSNNNAYASLAIGWRHNSSRHLLLNDSEKNGDRGDMKKPKSSSLLEAEDASENSKIDCRRVPRCTATKRVRVLTDYGFDLKDVLRNEIIKKRRVENQNVTMRRRTAQQRCRHAPQELEKSKICGSKGMKRVLLKFGITKKSWV